MDKVEGCYSQDSEEIAAIPLRGAYELAGTPSGSNSFISDSLRSRLCLPSYTFSAVCEPAQQTRSYGAGISLARLSLIRFGL